MDVIHWLYIYFFPFGTIIWKISKLWICLNLSFKNNHFVIQVDDLKSKLASQEVELAQKNEDANKLIQVVGAETEKVSKEKAIADQEEAKVSKINEEVSRKAKDCADDLAKAEPALEAAKEALNTLNKVAHRTKNNFLQAVR